MTNKFKEPQRYTPDHYMGMSHEHSFMRKTPNGCYVDGELYDELYAEYETVNAQRTATIDFIVQHVQLLEDKEIGLNFGGSLSIESTDPRCKIAKIVVGEYLKCVLSELG